MLGNSTNDCSWPLGDPRRAKYEGPEWAEARKAGARIYFSTTFRNMPTVNAEGRVESEGGLGKALPRLQATFRSTRVLGVRRRHAPKVFKKTGSAGCGFAIRNSRWKLIKGYGGGPDTWLALPPAPPP